MVLNVGGVKQNGQLVNELDIWISGNANNVHFTN
jgi:hypothetical protein